MAGAKSAWEEFMRTHNRTEKNSQQGEQQGAGGASFSNASEAWKNYMENHTPPEKPSISPVEQIGRPPAAQPAATKEQDTRKHSYAEGAGITQPMGIQYGAAASAPDMEKPGAAAKVSGKETVAGAIGGFGKEQKPLTEAQAIQQMARDSERAYYDYIHSAEYKEAVEAKRQKAIESGRSGGYAASAGMLPQNNGATPASVYAASAGITNHNEEDAALNEIINRAALLKNEADYWQDEATMLRAMADYQGWSEEDKALLDRFISGRIGSGDTLLTDIWQMSPMGGGIPGALIRGGQLISAEDARAELSRKYGREAVDKMAEAVARYQNAQRAQEVQEGAKRHSEGFVGGTAASIGAVGASTMGSITAPIGVVSDLLTRTGQFRTLDPNQAGNLPNIYAGAVKANVSRQIAGEDGNAFREGLALLYQGGMSAAENIARVAAGGKFGGLAMAASASFGQTVQQASEQGATPEQAIALGIVNAGIEAATEKIPLDNLFKAAKAANPLQALKQVLIQGGIEATTEEISLFGTLLTEAAILREKSSYQQTIREQMAQGKSYKEAKHFADMQILKEAGETAAVSFISGGLMEGANELVNYTDTKQGQQGAESPQAAETGIGKAASEKQEAPAKAGEQATGGDTGDTATQIAAPAQPVQAAVDEFRKTGTVSNRAATAILSDPQAVEQLAKETGITLPETNSGKRKAVKDAVEKLSNSTGRVTPESLAKYLVSANREEAQDKPLTPEQTAAGMRETFRQAIGANEVDAEGKGQQQTAPEQASEPIRDTLDNVANGQNVDNKLYNEDGTEDAGDPGESGMDHGYVGADTTKFKHETRRSKVYDNTYRNATDEDIRKAGQTAEELDPRIAEYEYISEKESLSNAQMRTRDQENINAEYEDLIGKEAWTGEDNDTAMIILKQFQKDGDVDRFRRLAKAQRQKGTTGGQLIQSFAKYSRDATKAAVDAVDALDNLSMADVPKRFFAKYGKNADGLEAWKKDMTASVLDIANEIERIGENDADAMQDMIRQLANFRKTTAWFGYSSNLTKNAERILKKLDFGTAKDMAVAQLAKIPDDFRKRSTGEVIKTIRFQNMLSSLLTVNRNLLGNATTGMIDAFSDSTGGRLADMLMAKATGKRTIGNDLRYGKEYLQAALDAGDMAALCAELDIPTNSESRYLTGRTRTFSPQSNVLGRFFSAYEKYLNYGLGVTDEFFAGGTEGAVSKSLEALGKKSGLTDKEIAELGQKAGRRRTYKEGRRIAKASSTIKQGLNYIGTDGIGAGDLVLPFAEIPAEMGQVAIDYSGVGFVEGITEMIGVIRDAKAGKEIDPYRQRKAAADFGRGMTGPAMIAAFTALAAAGVIAVHDDDDWDKSALEQSMGLSGAQFNLDAALRLAKGESTQWQQDDLVVSIDFLQPFNSQMYIGYLLSREDTFGDMLKAAPGATLKGITQSVLDIPMMGTFEDIADIISSLSQVTEGDFSPVEDAAGKLLGDLASGFIPAPMRQAAQFIDPVYRDTSGDNAMEGAANRLKSMIPGLSQTLPAQYDGLGNEQRRFDNGLIGFFNTFINPGTLKTIDTNEVVEYLSKMDDASVYPDYRAPKSFQYKGETVMISGKEMTEKYQRTYGRNVANLYGALIDSKEFRALSEDQQAEALKKAENYATKIARASVYPKYEGAPSGSTKEMINEILLKVKAADFAGSEKVFGEMTGAGVSNKTAYDIGKLMDSLKPQEGYKTVRDIQQAEAIAGANLTERDTIAALKAYGSDAQDENLDAVLAEGYSADQYVEMWRMISNEKEKGGDKTKRRTIQLLSNAYGISEEDATELYEIFYPKSK